MVTVWPLKKIYGGLSTSEKVGEKQVRGSNKGEGEERGGTVERMSPLLSLSLDPCYSKYTDKGQEERDDSYLSGLYKKNTEQELTVLFHIKNNGWRWILYIT